MIVNVKQRKFVNQLLELGLEKIAKIQNISKNELKQAKWQKKKKNSINDCQIELRNIKNIEKITKEELIFTLLKSKSSIAERNFEKLFNKNNNNTDNDIYNDKIRSKRSDIRTILNRLRNIVTKEDRKDIKKKIYEIEKKENLSDKEK